MKLIRSITLAASLLSATTIANAEELRLAIGIAGDNGLMAGTKAFAEDVKTGTNGAYTVKVFPASLLNFAEALTGLRDGIADIAFVVPAYHRAELPYTNLLVDMATASTNPVVMAGAANEFMFTCKPCMEEYHQHGQVFLGNTVTGPYYMYSKGKIAAKADFAGKTIRGFGPFGRWVQAMGASPVVIGANDIYEAMSQGQINGNTHTLETLKSLSLGDIADHVLNQPIAVYIGNSMFNMNQATWQKLDKAQKRAVLAAAAHGHAMATVRSVVDTKAVLDEPGKSGVERVEPADDVVAASAAFRDADLGVITAENRDKYNIADAEAQVARLKDLVKKWEGLVAGIDANDVDAVTKLYRDQLFDKVDLSTF